MPITKAAKKSLKQSEKRRVLNLRYKRSMKDVCKKIEDLCTAGKKKDAAKLLPQAMRAIDKAAKRGVVKENTAARKKSRLSRISA